MKLVVFVPVGYEDAVRDAISDAGAGFIGNYSHCTFQSAGEGTFLPREGSQPYIGTVGTVERVAEYRIETIAPEHKLHHILTALKKAHPYEEVAFDIFPLHNHGAALGLGRIGVLDLPVSLGELANHVQKQLGCKALRFVGNAKHMIHRVAVCGGSGAGLIDKAIAAQADVLLTGDIKYHEAQDAAARGLCLIDAGHFSTERILVPAIADYLAKIAEQNNWGLEIITAEESNVFKVL